MVVELRDELRIAKPKLMEGATVDSTISVPLRLREENLERKIAAGTAKHDWRRRENLVIRKLREIAAACTLAGTDAGEAAFETVNETYRGEVAKIEPLVAEADRKMNNAFSFIERAFGTTREMIVFVAELSTRSTTTKYIAHYGNDRYYAHNDELQVDETRKTLSDRVRDLTSFESTDQSKAEYIQDTLGVDMAGAAGIKRRGASGAKAGESSNADDSDDSEGDSRPELDTYYENKEIEFGYTSVCKMTLPDEGTIDEYYGNRAHEFGFASMSRMTLPSMSGKRVLDVCCRRGKGVYKLSSKVGESGHVVGVDWSPSYIADAKDGEEHAWRKNHLKKSNMEFRVAYPEDLMQAGIGDSTFDIVYINNVITLVYDIEKALSEFARVLKPGGLLICETIFADKERDPKVVVKAREIGNSIQAGRTCDEFFSMLATAGFGEPEIVDEFVVQADQGFKWGRTVDMVESDEDVTFSAVAINVRKA